LFNVIGLALLAVGAAGALFFALAATESWRKSKEWQNLFSPASSALLFFGVALVGAFAYSYSVTTSFSQAVAEVGGGGAAAGGAATPSAANANAQYKVLEFKNEVFTKQVSPVECEGARDLMYWRELRVYNATKIDERGVKKNIFLSTFTLNIKNKGNQTVSNLLVTEHIPDIIAAEPGQVFNFSVKPVSVRKGSVVVEWLFDKVDPGANQSVSYTVEKRVSADALKDLEVPNVVSQAVKAGAATPAGAGASASEAPIVTVAAQRAAVDWTVPGIVVAMGLVGAVIYFFSRKMRLAA
jgi:hypothetical protein